MRKILWMPLTALLGLVLVVVLTGLDKVPLTTTSKEAFRLFHEGDAHLTAYQFAEAVKKLEAAVEMDPHFAMAAAALAEGYALIGRRDLRDSLRTEAGLLAESLEDPLERMTVQLRLANNGSKAMAAIRDSLHTHIQKLDPDNIILLLSLAQEAKRKGDSGTAEHFFSTILESNPSYAAAYNELGYIHFNNGDPERAIEMLQRYAFLAPGTANPFDSLGEILLTVGRYDEAESQLKQALSIQSDYLPSLLNLVRVYLARGQLQKGSRLLAKINGKMAGTPFEQDVREFTVGAYFNNRLWKDLDRASAEFIALYPRHPRAILFRGIRLSVSEQPGRAEAIVDSFLADWRGQSRYLKKPGNMTDIEALENEFLALIHGNRGESAAAMAHWQRTLELTEKTRIPRELIFLREQYARSLLEAGMPGPALNQCQEIFRLNPYHVRALLIAAEAGLDLGRGQVARQYLTSLQTTLNRADPEHPHLLQARTLRRRLADRAGT